MISQRLNLTAYQFAERYFGLETTPDEFYSLAAFGKIDSPRYDLDYLQLYQIGLTGHVPHQEHHQGQGSELEPSEGSHEHSNFKNCSAQLPERPVAKTTGSNGTPE